MADVELPQDLRYTAEHEWLREGGDGVYRVGITDHAQQALGDIVFVDLPEEGRRVEAGRPCGEVESTKSVSELFAPVSGTVTARNTGLDPAPETVNADPYGDGWLFELRPDDAAAAAGLLDAEAYRALTGG